MSMKRKLKILGSVLLVVVLFFAFSCTENKQGRVEEMLPDLNSTSDGSLGFEGYYEDSQDEYYQSTRWYYAGASGDASTKKIAYSYNYQIDDYAKDLDNDGRIDTLICNCMSCADGHKEVYCYRFNGDSVDVGYVNWLEYGIDNLFYWGCNAVQTEYNDSKGKITIYYCDKDGDPEKSSEFDVGFDWIEYSEWDGSEDLPLIDIEDAYDLYGDE